LRERRPGDPQLRREPGRRAQRQLSGREPAHAGYLAGRSALDQPGGQPGGHQPEPDRPRRHRLHAGASPEALVYRIDFANDWAEGLGIKLSETLAKDALLPEAALELTSATPSALPPHVLTNLQQITVTVSTSSALTIDAGLAPPAGGGFEVRRRDGGFGTGSSGSASGDLVLRSPVRGFSIPIAAPEEIFFIRMYDASVPPLYSRFSAALVNHQPGS
jgi:hypothetical protein